MSSSKKPNRHCLLCPVCLKTNESLSVHLCRVCMKNATPEAINAVVEKAKKEAHELLVSGKIFNYGRLCQIMADANPLKRMIEELQRHHMVVTDIPPTLPDPVPGPSTTQQPQSAEPEESEPASDIASVSSGETFQCVPDVQWQRKNRTLMADKGLYQKHSLDHPLLKDFATYLEKELCNENIKQEVDNVSRYLYYVDPQTPSLRFVMNREKLRAYMCELSDAKLSKQTQLNYLKSLKRFLYFHTVNTSLSRDDVELHAQCKGFMEFIGLRQKVCSKQVVQRDHPEEALPVDCTGKSDTSRMLDSAEGGQEGLPGRYREGLRR
ncbi:uncharacterized protein LOC114458554 [Gouania willdenowi]|uniref:uncharacterized protein LOC114458554 n=1 Tax=Gouania willdenowi TaxID=441366 RepID=UPI001056E1BD|nr:uncharacterized protein LOC114458554 [Gouania willdenowi]